MTQEIEMHRRAIAAIFFGTFCAAEPTFAKITFVTRPPPPNATHMNCAMPILESRSDDAQEYRAGCRFTQDNKFIEGSLVKVSCSRAASTFFACAMENEEDLLRNGWKVESKSRDGDVFNLIK